MCSLVERGWELEMGLEEHSGYGASSGAESKSSPKAFQVTHGISVVGAGISS